MLCVVLVSVCSLRAANRPEQNLNRQFQTAVADYNAGHLQSAASLLERLLPQVRNGFEVHELLGLCYAGLSRDDEAIEQLRAAVRIQPDSAAARTNLAASLSHAGKLQLAGVQFRRAFQLEPDNYTANHNLGEFYISTGQIAEACPFLEKAQKIHPDAYDNGYDLATAELMTGRLEDARQVLEALLTRDKTGELHNLLGQIDEKQGRFLDAAHDYETAAHIYPSDDNLFAWGGELLMHRTYEPAVRVFEFAAQRYPNSPRLEIGLGMALYARGLYQESVSALLKAVDLKPDDPRCYQFLARAYDRSPQQADDVIERFRRYATLKPNDGLAQYYYAMSLWKGERLEASSPNLQKVESLLKKAIALDPDLAQAHLQLGNLYANLHDYRDSILEDERTLRLNPNQPDAHYRLATDYVREGQKQKANQEFAIYQKQRAAHMADDDRERAEVKQFLYSVTNSPAPQP
jgi:tetratricopeptide (TPR) repeat protein